MEKEHVIKAGNLHKERYPNVRAKEFAELQKSPDSEPALDWRACRFWNRTAQRNQTGRGQLRRDQSGFVRAEKIPKARTIRFSHLKNILLLQILVLLSLVYAGYVKADLNPVRGLCLLVLLEGLVFAALQDMQTMYFRKEWLLLEALMIPAGWIWNPVLASSHLPGLVFCLVLLVFVKKRMLGMADFWMMLAMALVFSWMQLQIAFLTACISGICTCLLKKERMLPFILYLSLGCWIVLLA